MDKKIVLIALIVFLVFFFVSYLFPNFLLSQELKVFDQYTFFAKSMGYFFPGRFSSKHLDDLVIITIDEASINKLNTRTPLPRDIHAALLEKIYKGKPKFIVYDLVFSGESENKNSDILFAKALEGKRNILFPYAYDYLGNSLLPDEMLVDHIIPIGYINKPKDFDAAIRRIKPIDFIKEKKIRDFSAEFYIFNKYYDYDFNLLSMKKRNVMLNGLKTEKKDGFEKPGFTLREDDTIWLKYQATSLDFKKLSAWFVLSKDFDPSVFKDKIVLIGITAVIAQDRHLTPFGWLAGVEIMANNILMFLDGRFIHEAPPWLKWFFIFTFCMLMVLLCYRLSIFKGLLFTISIVSIIVFTTLWLFLNNNYLLNPFKLVFICLISYITINFYKYTFVVLENMKLTKISTTDELTGLHTFRFFQVVIEHEFQKSLRYKNPFSLAMIDIDNFKKINDTHGHQNGNVVLRKIGKILLTNIRKADFPSRYGGEELAVVLPNSDTKGAYKCAEIIRQLIEKEDYFMTKDGPIKVTVSIGVSSCPSADINSVDDMIKLADAALYRAKHAGKNRVEVHKNSSENQEKTA
ncbi:MAG: diguanylate cyclase [Candidatus Omnitrophota bacterium]